MFYGPALEPESSGSPPEFFLVSHPDKQVRYFSPRDQRKAA